MKYLLDTHIILWFFNDTDKLSKSAWQSIMDLDSEKYVSIASAWEVGIKISRGKLTFDGGVAEFFRMIDENGFNLLPVKREYIEYIQNLAFHHRDPFDRLLVATVACERMNLITADENIRSYGISCVF